MKNKTYLLSFLMVVLVLQNGYSQDDRWKYIIADDKNSVYLDTRTVSKSNSDFAKSRIEIWTKWYCLKDCYNSSGGATLEFSMIKIEIDCNDRLLREMECAEYFLDGSTKRSESSEVWQAVIPETIGEWILEHVCNNY